MKLGEHEFEFCVASGALGYNGNGWWFEQPWRWSGLLDPSAFTIITKTLTFQERRGNLRWWCPWRCVRLIKNGVVNSVGLTNPGISWFVHQCQLRSDCKYIVSIAPESIIEATTMMAAIKCDPRTNIVGVELNVSCPNVEHDKTSDYILNIVDKLLPFEFPLIVKLSYDQPFEEICKELVGKVAGVDLINSVPWKMLHPKKSSPLKRYNLVGGVSGEAIKKYAEDALSRTAKLGVPIISGGGISSYDDVKLRFENGASAVSFGSVFIRRPWLPNEIVRKWSNDKIRKAKRQSFVRPDSSVECCKSDREKMVV